MNTGSANTACLLRALARSDRYDEPYTHWLLENVFTTAVIDRLLGLPITPAEADYGVGKREYNNATRVFFNPETQARLAVCAEVAQTLQSREVIEQIEQLCAVDLSGSYLRIEYTQDSDGFWLEPHTDIRVKRFTMLVYLSKEPEAADLGTDIYDAQKTLVKRAPFRSNHGLIFIPGDNTWHGFAKRPIIGVRRALIVNYVSDEWRDRFELAYPELPIAAPGSRL